MLDIVLNILLHVQFLHQCRCIHGDLKPRNIVKITANSKPPARQDAASADEGDGSCNEPRDQQTEQRGAAGSGPPPGGNVSNSSDDGGSDQGGNSPDHKRSDRDAVWKLIDMDASCKIGEPAGQKLTSSAFFPPEMAQHQLGLVHSGARADGEVVASVQYEMWYVGLLILQLSRVDAPTLFQATQADDMLKGTDMRLVAYFWDTVALTQIGESLGLSESQDWLAAADLVLWCLQSDPSRRPHSMQQVLAHMFFDATGGELRFVASADETWETFVRRQGRELHSAIDEKNSARVRELIAHGATNITTVDLSSKDSTVQCLHRAAFAGDAEVMGVLLAEVKDSWPVDVKQHFLDCRTRLDYTPLMVACECGHKEVVRMLEAKGCSSELVNTSGKTAKKLAKEVERECGWACVRPWDRGDLLHLGCCSVESFLELKSDSHNEHVHAGKRLWHSKLVVHHLNQEGMRSLEAAIEELVEQGFSIAVR